MPRIDTRLATGTLVASGVATIAFAAGASVLWRERDGQAVPSADREAHGERELASAPILGT
jgi:hypothetical protein